DVILTKYLIMRHTRKKNLKILTPQECIMNFNLENNKSNRHNDYDENQSPRGKNNTKRRRRQLRRGLRVTRYYGKKGHAWVKDYAKRRRLRQEQSRDAKLRDKHDNDNEDDIYPCGIMVSVTLSFFIFFVAPESVYAGGYKRSLHGEPRNGKGDRPVPWTEALLDSRQQLDFRRSLPTGKSHLSQSRVHLWYKVYRATGYVDRYRIIVPRSNKTRPEKYPSIHECIGRSSESSTSGELRSPTKLIRAWIQTKASTAQISRWNSVQVQISRVRSFNLGTILTAPPRRVPVASSRPLPRHLHRHVPGSTAMMTKNPFCLRRGWRIHQKRLKLKKRRDCFH
ncbi:unnamed protein product, partial [Trichogramma brassicae]